MPDPTYTTKRLKRRIHQRRGAFVPLAGSIGGVLEALSPDTETVYLVGRRPLSWEQWAFDELPEEWIPGEHFFEGNSPVLRFEHLEGRRVEVHAASTWFGPGAYSCELAGVAFELVAHAVEAAFGEGATLQTTPATTGRVLFQRCIKFGREIPVLPLELQDELRASSGHQGRIEVLDAAGDTIDGLYEYDGRFFYAALTWGMAVGIPERDHLDEYAGFRACRYLVDVAVPRDWREPFGLLGVRESDRVNWRYPAQPGETFTEWCDGAELKVAREAGWSVRIRERLLWPDQHGMGKAPLDTWRNKLVAARAALEHVRDETGADVAPDELAEAHELARAAFRMMLLQTIGAFHGKPQRKTHSVPIVEAGRVPRGAMNRRIEGDWILYATAPAQAWPELAHPEWSTAVWARARARLLRAPQSTGALLRTAGDVVAFRTDAIYLTARQAWADDHRVGAFALKRVRPGPLPAPKNGLDVLELRREAVPA